MANKNKLSIYLIKDEFAADDALILKAQNGPSRVIENVGTVYFAASHITTPIWVDSFFRGQLDATDIFTSNARAVLITRVTLSSGEQKTFVLTMGYGKYMLADDVIEDDFGLKVVLNTIPPNSLRRINKTNIGGNQKTSNEQLPLESGIDDFGFDIDRDLISAITGKSDDEDFATGILFGSDLLSLTAEVDIYNLDSFLRIAYAQYTSDEYKQYFAWIDHIKRVKDSRVIEALDNELVALINQHSPKIWMAVPEVISWEYIQGFKYAGQELHNDIDINVVTASFRDGLTHAGQLKSKTIYAISATDGQSIYTNWQAYKCVYGEVSYLGKEYCINNGRWFRIDIDFVQRVNEDYERIPISNIAFSPCPDGKKEEEYTQDYVATNPSHLLCMDRKVIGHGGGQSRVELCDVLTTDGKFIHIKPYSSSATLSHLFNQAVVSAELLLSDNDFFLKANHKIAELTANQDFLLSQGSKPSVILAIISDRDEPRPHIPFFSKVALRYTYRRLLTDGCQLSLKNIHRQKS